LCFRGTRRAAWTRRGRPVLHHLALPRRRSGIRLGISRSALKACIGSHRAVRRRVPKSPGAQFAAIERPHGRTCRARGWSSTSHNRTALHANRRTRRVRIEIRGTERAVLRGMDADRIRCASAVQGSLCEALSGTIDAPTIHECGARCRSDGAEVVRVHEIHVANIRVQNIDVSNERIVDVDAVDEPMAAREPGEERLTPAQREPAHAKA
jgi:hypothetical protein